MFRRSRLLGLAGIGLAVRVFFALRARREAALEAGQAHAPLVPAEPEKLPDPASRSEPEASGEPQLPAKPVKPAPPIKAEADEKPAKGAKAAKPAQGGKAAKSGKAAKAGKTGKPAPTLAELKSRSREDLYREAQRLGVKGRSKMTRAELERAVKKAGS